MAAKPLGPQAAHQRRAERADAERAASLGCDGIILTNHGGRQLDSCVAPFDMVPEISAAVGNRMTVIVDSGFRRGTDVVKALALGADAVMIGRATLYGLAAAGELGVRRALEILTAEIDRCLGQLGVCSIEELGPHLLRKSLSLKLRRSELGRRDFPASARFDPDRLRPAAELAVPIEQRGAGRVFAASGGDVPRDHPARLVDVHASIDVRCELAEEPVSAARLVGREAAGAVHCRPHELGTHLAVTAIERRIRHPGRGKDFPPQHGSREHAQPVASLPLRSAHEARGERMLAESGISD